MKNILFLILVLITSITEAQNAKRIVEQSIKNSTVRTIGYNRVSLKKNIQYEDFLVLLKYVNFKVEYYDYGSDFLLFGDTVVVDCKSISTKEEIVYGLPHQYVYRFDYIPLEQFKTDVLEKNELLKKAHEEILAEQERIKKIQQDKDEAIKKRQRDLQVGIYSGDTVNGKYQGKGKLEFLIDGTLATYEGNFSNGKFHGTGKLVIQKQYYEKYEGEFKFGVFDGAGQLVRQDNSTSAIYNGSFKSGLYDGKGKLEIVQSEKRVHYSDPIILYKEVYVGEFKAGMVEGDGEYSLYSNLKSPAQNISFKGAFKSDRQICSSLEGPFVMGMKDFWWISGRLEKTYSMGTKDEWVYKGDCKKGLFEGYGRILKKMNFGTYCNGKKYQFTTECEWSGMFSNGLKNGEFMFTGTYGIYNTNLYSFKYHKLVYRNDTLIVSGTLIHDHLQDLACAMNDIENIYANSYSDCITLSSNEYQFFSNKYGEYHIDYSDWKNSDLLSDKTQKIQFNTKGGQRFTGYIYQSSRGYYIKSSKGNGELAYYKDYSTTLKALFIELKCFTFINEGKI